MTKKLVLSIILLLAFSLSINVAHAQIEVTSESGTRQVYHTDLAEYKIKVTNNQDFKDSIKVRAVDIEYGQLMFPYGNIAILNPGQSKIIPVVFSPPRDVKIGSYALEILAISTTDPSVRASTYLRFDILSENPQLDVTIASRKELSPGELEVNVIVKNSGIISQHNVTGKIRLLNQEDGFALDFIKSGDTQIVFNKIYTIPSNYLGGHEIIVELYQNGNFLSEKRDTLSILPNEDLEILTNPAKGILSFANTITITNKGNVEVADRYVAPITSLKKHFLSASPVPLVKDNEEATQLVWTYSLSPGESITLAYKVSYLPLVLICLLIIGGAFAYTKYFMIPYSVEKQAAKDPSGENAIKINILVRNNTNTSVKSVKLTDIVPTPLKLVEDFGTAVPDVIKREDGKVNMFWNLGGFAPQEERLISYKVRSSLSILGRLTIPSAKIKVKPEQGRSKLFTSNKVFLKGVIEIPDE